MIVREIRLENVKSYGSPAEVVRLVRGVNAICGPNGAGKSTILEAIGCALFDHLPYRHEDFVKEGESHGTITVVVDSRFDQRTYEVVRRIARTNAAYYVHDPEIRQHVAQGVADVKRWLHQHLQIPDEVDLPALFLDAVGPPQGTLTAAFLEAPGPRKAKFNRLLRVQEYDEAWAKLRALDTAIEAELTDLSVRIANLEGRTSDRASVELERAAKRDEQVGLALQLSRFVAERDALDRLLEGFTAAEQTWREADAALRLATVQENHARDRRTRAHVDWLAASDAATTCADTVAARDEFQSVEAQLAALEDDQREQNRLCEKQSALAQRVGKGESEVERLEGEIDRLQRAEAEIAELTARIPEQDAAEQRLVRARELKKEAVDLGRAIAGKPERFLRAEARVARARGEIALAEQHRVVAAELAIRRSRYDELATTLAAAQTAEGQLQEIRLTLNAELRRAAALRDRVGQLDRSIVAQSDVAAGEPVAVIQERFNLVTSRRAAAVSHLEHARQTRVQVAGGLCPFLNETCKNLRPGVTLDAHFDGEIERWSQESATLSERVEKAEKALANAQKAEDRLRQVGEWQRQRAMLAADLDEAVARVADHQRKLREASTLATARTEARERERMALRAVQEAEQAERELRRLPALGKELDEATRDHDALRDEITRDRARLAELHDVDEEVAAAQAAKDAVGTPRETAAHLRAEVVGLPRLRLSHQRAVELLSTLKTALAEVERELTRFADLDAQLDDLRRRRAASRPAYERYVAAAPLAATLDQRATALHQAGAEHAAAADTMQVAREHLDEAAAKYDRNAHEDANSRLKKLHGDVATTQANLDTAQSEERRLLDRLREIAALEAELGTLREQVERIEEERRIATTLRNAIRSAGPEITRQLLARISRIASRINAEILNQSGTELEWTSEYEVTTRRQGETRGFAQLSGGEQMAAALAVRLAVLRDLSNVRIAFLDEPTAHLDQERRTNLGDQVQRLQGFDQLVVISHDDTFDGLFGHVVRIGRQDGVSRVIDQN